jgi:hypothetical protein
MFGCNFTFAKLTGAIITNSNLNNSNFDNIFIKDITFTNSSVENAQGLSQDNILIMFPQLIQHEQSEAPDQPVAENATSVAALQTPSNPQSTPPNNGLVPTADHNVAPVPIAPPAPPMPITTPQS